MQNVIFGFRYAQAVDNSVDKFFEINVVVPTLTRHNGRTGGKQVTKTEAEQLAKGKTLVELYEIIRLSAHYEANAENDLVVAVVDAEIRSRTGNDHPVGLASLLAPR